MSTAARISLLTTRPLHTPLSFACAQMDSTQLRDFHWHSVLAQTPAVLAWLVQQHWQPSTRIAVCSANTPLFAALLQAAFLYDITLVLINHRLSPADCLHSINSACVTACISDQPWAHADCPVILWNELPTDIRPYNAAHNRLSGTSANTESIALVLYTSGSSGNAKAVRLSRRALLYASHAACAHNALTQHDHYLCCLPLDHIGGASIVFRSAVAAFPICLCTAFDAAMINHALAQHRISAISLVPTMLQRLMQPRLLATPSSPQHSWPQHLNFILIGGAYLSATDRQHAQQLGCTPSCSYGMSEHASQICTQPRYSDAGADTPATMLAGYSAQSDQHQQLSIRSPAAFSGYESTAMHTTTPTLITHDMHDFFNTNDRGYLAHAHDKGEGERRDTPPTLHILGRTDDIIICGGENISLQRCEEKLLDAPAIDSCACSGFDDSHWGQICAALIVCTENHTQPQTETWIQQQMRGIHKPKHIAFCLQLPLLASGKIDRQQVRTLLRASLNAVLHLKRTIKN